MNTIRLPIRFKIDSTMETITEGTDEYYATLLANSMRIEPGELPISTAFGTLDPSFEYQTPKLAVQNAARHIPEIAINDVSSKLEGGGSIGVMVNFTIKES
jgi:hypothetical protein